MTPAIITIKLDDEFRDAIKSAVDGAKDEIDALRSELTEALDRLAMMTRACKLHWAETGSQEIGDKANCPEFVADMKRLRALAK